MSIWHEEYELYRKYIHNISRFYKQNEHVGAYVELGLSLLAIIIFLVFAIRPTTVTITEKVREMQNKEEVVEKLNIKIDSLSIANSLLQQEKEKLDLLEQAVPDNALPEEYIVQIDALAARSNTVLESMAIEDTPVLKVATSDDVGQKSGSVEWFPFSATVTGDYTNIAQFTDSVENLRRPMKIISARLETQSDGSLSLSITGEIPYLNYD